MKKINKIVSFLLAVIMLATFATPVSAMDIEPVQDIVDVTDGWTAPEDNADAAPPTPEASQPDPEPGETSAPEPEPESEPGEQDDAGQVDHMDAGESVNAEEPQSNELDSFFAELERFMNKIDLLEPASIVAASGIMGISPMSGDVGDTIQVSFTNQMGSWSYGGYYGDRWPMITASGAVAATCAVLDGNDPVNGTYSNRQDAPDSVLRLLVAYDKGSYSLRDLQFAIWNITTESNGGLISAAASVDTTGYTAYKWSAASGAQPIYTLHYGDEPDDPAEPDEPKETRIEIETRVEVETSTTIENSVRYSEAWGQITIRKENQNHESLDGAQFDIRLEFANGEVRDIRNWEVDNGARLLTWQHPAGDISPVKVTVTEVRPPQHYSLDPTPQVATVAPTYTTFFIQETRMWTTEMSFHYHLVFHIGGGEDEEAEPAHAALPNRANPISNDGWEWIAASSESGGDGACPVCSHEFGPEHNSAQVGSDTQETASMTPGDRETTLTFRNVRERGQLVITKLCAVTSQPLAGAEFRVDGVDLGNAGNFSQTVTTGADGTATVNGLFPGSYRVTEIGCPPTHNNDAPPQTFAVQSNETVRLTFRNTRRQGLQILKVDPEGNALQGAVFQVERGSGQILGSFITDANGLIIIPSNQLTTGDYVATEIQAPDGFLIDEANNPQRIYVDNTQQNQNYQLTFRNFRMPSIEIIKVDADDPTIRLEGAAFRITNIMTGQIFEGTTDKNGRVNFPKLDLNTTYLIEEIAPAGGHLNSGFRQEIVLRENRVHTIVVSNSQKPKLLITKIDEATGNKLPGAVFRVAQRGSAEYVEVTTGADGTVLLDNLGEEWYQVTEIRSPSGYILDDTVHDIELIAGKTAKLVVNNSKKPTLTIKKIDEATGKTLEGAIFRVTKQGAMEYQDVATGKDGTATITGLSPGWVIIEEKKAPNGYILDPTPRQIEVKPGEDAEIVIQNRHRPSLTIVKIDDVTKQPLQYAKFRISIKEGKTLGEYVTDADGKIYLENLDPAIFVIEEIAAPDGYNILDGKKEILIEWGTDAVVEIPNQPVNPLLIKKVDAKTGEPLSGATFVVTKVNGEFVGEYKTGRNGFITVTGLQPGWFSVVESKAPDGYIINNTPKQVELKMNAPAIVEFENQPLNGLHIKKIDADTGLPLYGAKFRVSKKGGNLIGEYMTDAQGEIVIDGLEPGWFTIEETAAAEGYALDGTPKDIELKWGQFASVEFTNRRLPGLQVRKLDANTGEPLSGAKFRVQKMNGEYVGDYVTNGAGFFVVSDLATGWFTVFETQAPAGYITDSTAQNVELKPNGTAVVEFQNKPLAGLQIKKVDDVTGLPMAGVEFFITELDGRRIGTFTTDDTGLLFVPNLKEGWLIVTETKSLPGYKLDAAPRNVEIKADRLNTLEYRNQPYPFLQIKKIDSESGKPIAGVKFKIFDKNSRELGEYTTNNLGIIKLTGMEPGTFYIRESQAAQGYVLDETVKEVTVYWGKTTTVEVKNTPMATLRLRKVDSVTGKSLPGAGFILYDAKNNIVGEYTSDENGLVVFPKSLPAGQFKLKEIKAPTGYVLLDKPVTITLKAGETSEIQIPNDPIRGKIQIVKKSADANTITKAKAGAVLAGAVFEVVNEKLEVVDTITTDSRGIATTKDLPLGKYAIKEITAPDFYVLDDSVFYAEIKLHGDIVRFEVLNTSSDISVTVEKRGNVEALTGDLIRYDFSNISNASNIALDEFYLHDQLPTDAVRLETLVTGTWSERLTYRVTYRTNLKTEYRVWKNNLLTTANHELNVSDLKLAANEYVTDFKLEFGTVQPGFHEKDAPYIMTRVLDGLPHEHRIVNKITVGGKVGKEIIYNTDSWVTIAFSVPKGPLPRTGF